MRGGRSGAKLLPSPYWFDVLLTCDFFTAVHSQFNTTARTSYIIAEMRNGWEKDERETRRMNIK